MFITFVAVYFGNMVRKTFFALFVFFNVLYFNTVVHCQTSLPNDSLLYANILKNPIHKIIYNKDGYLFIIAGNNKEKLIKIKINNKGAIEDLVERYNLPPGTVFSDVLCMRNSCILIGTKNQYIYFLRNKKITWLNKKYGLTDSIVENFGYDKKQKLVVVKTEKSRFLLKNENKIRNIRFAEIKDTVSTVDEIIDYFKQYVKKPFQKKFLGIVTGVDFSFRKDKYLNDNELVKVKSIVFPGDVILRRNELQVTNIGIPGFWKHSGIYVGDLSQFDSFFTGLPMLNGQQPSDYIKENYPEIYKKLLNEKTRIIEAIAEGVVIEPVEHIAKTDYLAVLRTHLDKEDIFKSLLTAFEYLGTPYDYLFDFNNDNELVCSELLYNSFRPHHDKNGITFRMGMNDGKPFLFPNDIAKQYSKEKKEHKQQFSLVYFFDAALYMKSGKTGTEDEFCKSWKRR